MPSALKTGQRPITFSDRNDFDAAQLIQLYRQAPWAKDRALNRRGPCWRRPILSFRRGTARLVGFGRVPTDYVFRASIWDVIVDRDYQVRRSGPKSSAHPRPSHAAAG